MSMLVRKGTMLHRSPSRRSAGRRASRESLRKQRNRDVRGSDGGSGTSCSDFSPGNVRRSLGNESGSSGRLSDSHQKKERTTSVHLTPNPLFETHRLSSNGTRATVGNPGDRDICRSTRHSSSTSRISGEERRELYRYSKFFYESHNEYSSIMSQLREAKEESSTGWEYSKRFFNVFFKSAFGTGLILILAILPLSMALMGMKNLESCPLEPRLPLYFLVSGIFGLLRIIWILYMQRKSRKSAEFDLSFFEEETLPGRWSVALVKWALNLFLVVLFVLGNVWTLSLSDPSGQRPPLHDPTLQHPQEWCSKVFFVFAVAHLYVVYTLLVLFALSWTLPCTYFAMDSHLRPQRKARHSHASI